MSNIRVCVSNPQRKTIYSKVCVFNGNSTNSEAKKVGLYMGIICVDSYV